MTTKSPSRGGALGGLQPRQALAHRLDLLLDLLLADRRLAARHLEALVLAELGRRQHADLDRELQRLALRRAARRGRARGRRRARSRRPRSPRSTSSESVSRTASSSTASRPMPLDHERRGHLAAAEARQLQLAPELPGLALEAPLDLAGGHLHLQAHARVAELGERRLQGRRHAPPRYRAAACAPDRERLSAAGAPRRRCGPGPAAHLLGGALGRPRRRSRCHAAGGGARRAARRARAAAARRSGRR